MPNLRPRRPELGVDNELHVAGFRRGQAFALAAYLSTRSAVDASTLPTVPVLLVAAAALLAPRGPRRLKGRLSLSLLNERERVRGKGSAPSSDEEERLSLLRSRGWKRLRETQHERLDTQAVSRRPSSKPPPPTAAAVRVRREDSMRRLALHFSSMGWVGDEALDDLSVFCGKRALESAFQLSIVTKESET